MCNQLTSQHNATTGSSCAVGVHRHYSSALTTHRSGGVQANFPIHNLNHTQFGSTAGENAVFHDGYSSLQLLIFLYYFLFLASLD